MTEPRDRRWDDSQPDDHDDDVPFRLPKVDDSPTDESDYTPSMWAAGDATDGRDLPLAQAVERAARLTPPEPAPPPAEPEPRRPALTLPGSGGLDPNPDFATASGLTARGESARAGDTMPSLTGVNAPQSKPASPYQRPAQPAPTQVPPPPQQRPPAAPGYLPQRPAPARRRRSGCAPGCVWLVVGFLVIFCGGSTLLAAGLGIWGINRVETLADERLKGVDTYQGFQSTFFYDRDGRLLYEVFNEGRRTNVAYSEFPKSLVDATIAIEDDNFWTNPGIDLPATLRAFAQFVGIGGASTGGSTITQQLVRNVLFDFEYRAERSVQRKVEEILLALVLTTRKSKEDILAMYLNEIYYGNLAYGAEAAAQTFFAKPVKDLTLGEAALLAGLPQAPAELDPLNPDPAVQDAVYARWRLVLDRMVRTGVITDAQRSQALRDGLTFVTPTVSLKAPHFTIYAQRQLDRLMARLGYSPEQITRGGLRVTTTVDLELNDFAQTIARDQVLRLGANNVGNGAVVVLKPLTGEVLAMVGSIDYANDAIDGRVNVAVALRQPGSTMKPFTYATALELGMTPGDVIWDTRTRIGIPGQPMYEPRNYDGAFHGPMTMRSALANSYNIPAVQTLRRVGVDTLLAAMKRFGVQSLGDDAGRYGLSLTLGGGEITLLELTSGYAVFANEGVRVAPTAILCVQNSAGDILYQYENGCTTGTVNAKTVSENGYGAAALDPRIAYIISDILADNAARTPAMGANSPLNTGALPTSVKTGTTDDFRDNWTIGYTRNVAVGVWVGNSSGQPMVNTSGLTGAAPIWNAVISGIYNNGGLLDEFRIDGNLLPDRQSVPDGLSLREICDVRALRDPATDCPRRQEWFLDTPAALPGPDGGLVYPPPAAPTQQPQAGPGQPQLSEVSPGVFRVLAFRLDPGIASAISFAVQPGQQPPPPPIYCQVPVDLAPVAAGAQELLFIAPPPVADDAPAAEIYARERGLAFLPTIACSPELLQSGGGYGPGVTTAIITSPAPGQVLTVETPILGTVQIPNDGSTFYKIDIIGGQFPDWTTIGTTHTESVVNGVLENLFVPGLLPGDYRMRLVIVRAADILQTPYEVPFSVAR